jgi:hypothetical protein
VTRYTKVIENDDGWSDWIQPVATGYKMACCDCDLVHTIDFRIHRDSTGQDRVQLRASRHVRATAAKRLWRRRWAAQAAPNQPTPTPQT